MRLIEIHAELARLLHAVREELPISCDVTLSYDFDTYLEVVVDCPIRHRQLVVDRLSRGVLNGPYDYRFSAVQYSPTDDSARQWVRAAVNLHHDGKR